MMAACKSLKTKNLILRWGRNEDTFPAMVPIEHLGRALATLRDKHNKTQEEVASVAGVTPSMISNYEREKEKPSLDSLWKILGAMNCSLIDLEAALRFVRGDAFPLHCRNWRIRIESDEYPPPATSRQPSEIAEPGFDLERLLQADPPIPNDDLQYLGKLTRVLYDITRLPNRPNR